MMNIIGKNVRSYPCPLFPVVLACCLIQRVDGVRAYAAVVADLSTREGNEGYDYVPWDWVAAHGNPLGREEAQTHFPSLRREEHYVE